MIVLMLSGLSLSGKTFLAKRIVETYGDRFAMIDSRSIHDFLNTQSVFQDENEIGGPSYSLRQEMTDAIQEAMIKVFGENGINLIIDSCNRKKEERGIRIKLVKDLVNDAKIVIIHVDSPYKDVVSRAKVLDKSLNGTIWQDLVSKQKQEYENPSKKECDYLIEYDGSDIDSVIKSLKKIV